MQTPPFVNISQFLFSKDLGPGISTGPWKAVPKGQAAHLGAKRAGQRSPSREAGQDSGRVQALNARLQDSRALWPGSHTQ